MASVKCEGHVLDNSRRARPRPARVYFLGLQISSFQGRAKIENHINDSNDSNYSQAAMSAQMDPADVELRMLMGMMEEIMATVASAAPQRPRPENVSLVEQETINPISWRPGPVRYEASFLVDYQSHPPLVIKFPLLSVIHPDIITNKIKTEVGAMMWAKNNTPLPIPKVHACDPGGKFPWNSTRRPFILVDFMPGKHITNKDWEQMTVAQKCHVSSQVAEVVSCLSLHAFDKIGSLYPNLTKGTVELGPLITFPLALYCLLHGKTKQLSRIFQANDSPYLTATEYMIGITNAHLLRRALLYPSEPSSHYVEMWIYRSLIPALVLEKFDRGPFVLVHGHLDRTALLFDDNYDLSGIVNWEWTQVEPLQIACLPPPFLTNLPMSPDGQEFAMLWEHYKKALETYEDNKRKKLTEKTKVPPILNNLAREGYVLAGLIAKRAEDDLSEPLWRFTFTPIFGQIEKTALLSLYGSAPGLKDEHKRTCEYLQILQVNPCRAN